LCAAYWQPLYFYLRRTGMHAPDAEDIVQGFLSSLLSGRAIAGVERERGRFRSYLLGALRNYLSKVRTRERAAKRGGDQPIAPLTLDVAGAERQLEIPDHRTPESAYAYAWAMAILRHTEEQLAERYAGKREMFAALRPFLLAGDAPSYREVAERLQLSEGSIRVAVHRLRNQFRALLREQVAQTVSSEAEVDDELRAVIAAVGEG
jgi:RNA polymerase sigma-70 factor (ECF subfamily)